MPNQETPARLLSAAQAAAETGLAKRTINLAIADGRLKAEMVGGMGYVITRRALERFMAKREAA